MKTVPKKIGLFLIILVAPYLLIAQIKNPVVVKNLTPVKLNLLSTPKKTLHPVALKAIRNGKKPGTFKNVKVKYKNNVVFLNEQTKSALKKEINNIPVLPKQKLRAINLDENKVYIDNSSDLIFRPMPLTKDTIILAKPELSDFIQDVEIPLQQVYINSANTDYTLQNTEVEEAEDNGIYTMRLEFKDTLYHFSKEIKKGKTKTKIDFNVRLDGFIGMTEPYIEGRYTYNDGYKLVFHAKEKMDLKVLSDFKLDTEVSFPVWGYDIPIEGFGSCKIGIFMVFEANGEIHMEAGIVQGLQVDVGIKGKTFMMVPRSANPIFDIKKSMDIDYEITGKIKAFGGTDITAELSYKDYKLLKIRNRAGFEVKADFDGKNIKNFNAELGARFLIDGKLEIKSYKKDFEWYNKYHLIWKKQVKNTGGYVFAINSADAYFDRVWGKIYKVEDSDTIPYQGDLILKVESKNKNTITYNGKTNEEGIFAMTEIPLTKGDKVYVKATDAPNWSDGFDTQIPFNNIVLTYADYYTDIVEGSIGGEIDYFPKTTTPKNQNVTGNIKGINKNIPKGVLNQNINLEAFKPKIKITREMFENSITYKGDIQLIVTPTVHQTELKIEPVNINLNKNKNLNSGNTKFNKIGRVNKNISKNITKIDPSIITKRVINLPFGMFKVTGVNIKPGDKVKARVNIDGFVLESEYVMSDGLIFTPIYTDHMQGSIKTKVIKADDSYAVVNAFRSDKTPAGQLHMLMGIDMKHNQPHKDFPTQKIEFPKLKQFKNAVRPLVYFNKKIDLKPMQNHTGFAIAHTGPWQVQNPFYDPKNIVSITPFDGHRFEYQGYIFDGKWTGYKYYQPKCSVETSSKRILNDPKTKNSYQMNKIKKMAPRFK